MKGNQITIKFYRSSPDVVETYGPEFNRLLNKFVGGAKQWNTIASHGFATTNNGQVTVERFEDGPWLEVASTLIPAITPLLTPLIEAWLNFKKKQKDEIRTMKLAGCGRTFEGPVKSKEDMLQIIAILCSQDVKSRSKKRAKNNAKK